MYTKKKKLCSILNSKWVYSISQYLTLFILKTLPEKTPKELETIEYGLQAFFMNIWKYPLILFLASKTNNLREILYAILFFGLARTFAGGLHAKKGGSCLILSILYLYLIVILSIYFNLDVFLICIIFFINIVLMFKYAPADTEEKPLYSSKHRVALKKLSIGMIFILFIAAYVSQQINQQEIADLIAFSTMIESVIITPLSYKIMKRSYKNYEKQNIS